MAFKEYARCCVRNRATLAGTVLGLVALKLVPFNDCEGIGPFVGGMATGASFYLNYLTAAGLDTYKTFKKTTNVLNNSGTIDDLRSKIKPRAYCGAVGFKMALEDYARNDS